MLGILVQLLLSWLLLWLVCRRNLSVLGFRPTQRRLAQFALFFFFTALCCAGNYLLQSVLFHQQWMLNPKLTLALVGEGLWWNFKSVLFEELIFRGALLYLLIKYLGNRKAIIISAVAFGVYHWFSQSAFGNWQAMAMMFCSTGAMGWLLALAYVRTASLYIPIAIHFGWNSVQGVLFSNGPIGAQVWVGVPQAQPVTVSYAAYFTSLLLPLVVMLLGNFLLLRWQTKGARKAVAI